MLAQTRAITRGEEAITPSIIRSVAHDSFRLARPILDALKSGNIQELYKVDDVLPVDYDTLLRVITNKSNQSAPIRIQKENPQGENVPASNEPGASQAQKPPSPTPPVQKAPDASPE